jgi:hypothetical protein
MRWKDDLVIQSSDNDSNRDKTRYLTTLLNSGSNWFSSSSTVQYDDSDSDSKSNNIIYFSVTMWYILKLVNLDFILTYD